MAGIATGAAIAAAPAITAGGVAAAAGLAQLGVGLWNSISGKTQQDDAIKAMQAQAKNSPLYKIDKSVNDYYQEALNRFFENPTQSAQSQLAQMNANIAATQGINALQTRRSAIGGIDNIGRGLNTALQNAGANAEGQRNARFGQLGGATQMMNAENQFGFDVNKMTPYNRQFGLTQEQAAASGQRFNAGLQTLSGAANNAASMYAAKANADAAANANANAAAKAYGQQIQQNQQLQNNTTSTATNVPGSPYGKYDYNNYLPNNNVNSNFGAQGFGLPSRAGMGQYNFNDLYNFPKAPFTNNNAVIDENFTPEY